MTVARHRHHEQPLPARLVHGLVPSAHAGFRGRPRQGHRQGGSYETLAIRSGGRRLRTLRSRRGWPPVLVRSRPLYDHELDLRRSHCFGKRDPLRSSAATTDCRVASNTCSFACFSGVYLFLTAGPDWVVESVETRFVGQSVTVPATSGGACPSSGIEVHPIDQPFTGEAGVAGRSLRGWMPHFPGSGWNNSLPSFTAPADSMLVGRVGKTSYPPCTFADVWDTKYSVVFKNVATGETVVLSR